MLFAVKDVEAQFYDRLHVYMWTGIVLFAIGLLIWASLKVRSWFFDSDESEAPAEEMITQFRQLKRQGELSDEEFRLISQRLSGASSPPATGGKLPIQPQSPPAIDVDESADVEED
jgi:hypothetical protein